MKFKDKKVLVFGSGISGVSAAALLLQEGAEVVLYDGNDRLDAAGIKEQIEGQAKGSVSVVLGAFPEALLSELSLVVMSPGVPTDLPSVNQMRDAGIPIWGEIELAYVLGKGDVLAITGTNGKTTTTALTGEIMAAHFGKDKTFVVGNIGTAYTGKALETKEDSVTVAEISSFQLETALTFRPHVSAILNITPDHLNRHKTMECYIAVKESITKNQTKDDFCVLNYDDEVLRSFAQSCPATVIFFSSRHSLDEGFCMDGSRLVYRHDGKEEVIGTTDQFNLVGQCNYENIMAAAAIGTAMGVPMETIRQTAYNFKAVEHRIEYTATKKQVRYYNDSKGTNPDAAIKGIQAMDRPTLLIGGGYDKGSSYSEWIQAFDGKVKYLVLIGQTREKIAAEAKALGFTDIVFADSLAEAVQFCADHAEKGDAVLLSPACASWGMFPNYEVRGRMFKELVNNL